MTKSLFEVACVIFSSSSSFICLFSPLTSKVFMSNSPFCLSYNLCDVSLENLELDQPIIPLSIFFFIHVTCLLNILLIMQGEILSWSPAGHKGLIGQKKIVQLYDLYQRCKAKRKLQRGTQVMWKKNPYLH